MSIMSTIFHRDATPCRRLSRRRQTCSSWRSLLWFFPRTSSLLTPVRSATFTKMKAKQPYVSIWDATPHC